MDYFVNDNEYSDVCEDDMISSRDKISYFSR